MCRAIGQGGTRSAHRCYFALCSLLSTTTACILDSVTRCESETLSSPGAHTCFLPNWSDRPFVVELPESSPQPLPVLLAFHGAGGIGVVRFQDKPQDSDLKTANIELFVRRGIVENLDVGLRLYTFSAENSAKWRFRDGAWGLALMPG